MNKAQLVAALADRLGDRGAATLAVDELLDVIVRTVQAGEPVSIIGFGVFECRGRAARVARNPRTGVAIEVAATNVPAFRAGAGFRAAVSGARALPAQDAPAATGKTDAGEPADNGGSKPGKALAKAAGKGPDKSSAKTGGKNKERGKHKDGGKGPDKGAKGGDKGAAKDKSGVKKSSNGRERKKG